MAVPVFLSDLHNLQKAKLSLYTSAIFHTCHHETKGVHFIFFRKIKTHIIIMGLQGFKVTFQKGNIPVWKVSHNGFFPFNQTSNLYRNKNGIKSS